MVDLGNEELVVNITTFLFILIFIILYIVLFFITYFAYFLCCHLYSDLNSFEFSCLVREIAPGGMEQ